jgi:membrane protein
LTKFERIIVNSKPITFIRNKSKKTFLPGFNGLCLYDVAIYFFNQIRKHGLNVRAAAISYNFLMAIPALTLFLCTLVPYFPVSKAIYSQLSDFVQDIAPNSDTQKIILGFLDDFFNKPKGGLVSIGFLLVVIYSSNAMMGIIRSFDRSIINKRKTNFIKKRLRAIQLVTILILLLLGTLLISAGQGALFKDTMQWLHIKNTHTKWLIQNLRWIVIIALFYYSIAFIYRYAPTMRDRWRIHTPGTVLSTTLIILLTSLFSVWVQNFSNYNKFYGSIGTLLIIMLLVFLNSLMLLIGYELNISIMYLSMHAEDAKKKQTASI